MMSWAIRACPPLMSRAVTREAIGAIRGRGPKSGVCHIAQEAHSWKRLQDWLTSWRRNPEFPSDSSEKAPATVEDDV